MKPKKTVGDIAAAAIENTESVVGGGRYGRSRKKSKSRSKSNSKSGSKSKSKSKSKSQSKSGSRRRCY